MSDQISPISIRDNFQKLFECPVCVQVFRNPKLLPCGHSICAECCILLCRDRFSLTCPVCRRPSNIPADKLPINFGLRDLVNHYADSAKARKFSCGSCERRVTEHDSWSCQDCNKVICSYCALKNHAGTHVLREMRELLKDKENELAAWREEFVNVGKHVVTARRQIEANNVRISQCAQHLIRFTVGRKLAPSLENETKALNQEMQNLQKRCNSVNAVRLVINDGNTLNDFQTLKDDYKHFVGKQEKLTKRQTDALCLLRKCEVALAGLVLPNANPPTGSNTTCASNALSTLTNNDVGSSSQNTSPFHGPRRFNNSFAHPSFGLRLNNVQPSTDYNNDGNVIRLRRTPNSSSVSGSQIRSVSYFPDIISVENDEGILIDPVSPPRNDFNSDGREEDIQLEDFYSPVRQQQAASPAAPSCPALNVCRRPINTSVPATLDVTDGEESDNEDVRITVDDETGAQNDANNSRSQRNGVLARFFNQIERRMNNDLDDGHRVDSVTIDGDEAAEEGDGSTIDEMDFDAAAGSSNARTRNAEQPSTSRGVADGSPISHKRGRPSPSSARFFRRIPGVNRVASDSSEGERGEEEEEDDDLVDSPIRFTVLRKH